MTDTHFYLPRDKRDRLATVYSATPGGLARAPDAGGTTGSQGAYVDGPRKSFSGGAGLLSTATDYARFLQMLLNGGELDGERILSRKTVELMTVDHLGAIDFRPGQGFGLGVSVLEDVGARGTPGLARRVRLGRRIPHDVLGRPARRARRRAPDAAPAGRQTSTIKAKSAR